MIGTDEWSASDDLFAGFLAGVTTDRMSPWEHNLFRHHRYLRLLEEAEKGSA